MSSEREASLPIEDFGGVNLNADKEDISPNQLLQAGNLWEKTLGVLETRGGSITNQYINAGIKTGGLDKVFKLYKGCGEKNRFVAVHCEPDVEHLAALPAGVVLSFVNNASGWWNKDNTFGGATYNMVHTKIHLRFVGYGVDKTYTILPTAMTGYSAGTAQALRLEINSGFDNSITTGVEIYATVRSGKTETAAVITDTSNYQEQTLWCGFVDVTTDNTQINDFLYTPAGYDTSLGAGPVTIGDTERSLVAVGYASGTNGGTGTFIGGKTYYVAVLPQYMVFTNGSASRACYRNPTVDVFGGDIVPVTIPGTETGYIKLHTINPNTVCFLVCIGDTPQTLQPVAIFNDSEVASAIQHGMSGTLTGTAASEFYFGTPPANNPGCVDFVYSAAGVATLAFRFSDFSRNDMFMGINDDGTSYPIFATRLHAHVNDPTEWQDVLGGNHSSGSLLSPGSASDFPWMYYSVNDFDQMQKLGNESRYEMIQWEDYALCVSDYDPLSISAGTEPVVPSRTNTNYFIIDGHVAAAVIEDYQATTQLTLPNMRYIAKFDSSVILGGGIPNIDPLTGLKNDSSKMNYFSRALNPFDFTIAGAAATTHATISVDDDGENITGYGIYTNTTADSGPISQLITAKKNCMWILNEIPSTDSGALSKAVNRILTKKVGGYHRTFVNTPIGLICASNDNVYLVREEGEPTPIGQNIAPLLVDANMQLAVGCYHDKHYKLAFSTSAYTLADPDSPNNNVEMWLNINKMIEKRGGEDWVGPMTGRGVDDCFVEDRDGDGDTYNTARNRFCVDKTGGVGRIFRADVAPSSTAETVYDAHPDDFAGEEATPVTGVIETKDFDITQQDNNWMKLLKRFYCKVRSNWVTPVASSARYILYVDGTAEASVDFGTSMPDAGAPAAFYGKPLTLVRLFPSSRLRARTFRLKFTFAKRIAIGGVQLNYQIERRRI